MINPKQAQNVKRLADEYATAAYNEGSAILEALASFATTKARNALYDAIDAATDLGRSPCHQWLCEPSSAPKENNDDA